MHTITGLSESEFLRGPELPLHPSHESGESYSETLSPVRKKSFLELNKYTISPAT